MRKMYSKKQLLAIVKSQIVIPDAPTEDGTYVLKCTVSSGEVTYEWVLEEESEETEE